MDRSLGDRDPADRRATRLRPEAAARDGPLAREGDARVQAVGQRQGRGSAGVGRRGGYATASGGETRWGAVARADALTRLTDRGADALVAHGIRTVVDLRSAAEL